MQHVMQPCGSLFVYLPAGSAGDAFAFSFSDWPADRSHPAQVTRHDLSARYRDLSTSAHAGALVHGEKSLCMSSRRLAPRQCTLRPCCTSSLHLDVPDPASKACFASMVDHVAATGSGVGCVEVLALRPRRYGSSLSGAARPTHCLLKRPFFRIVLPNTSLSLDLHIIHHTIFPS